MAMVLWDRTGASSLSHTDLLQPKPLLLTLDNAENQRICTSAGLCLLSRTASCGEGTQQSLQHTAALGIISSCSATQSWGRNRNLLVAICVCCLFIKFQAATVLHLGSLLGALRSRTALLSICLCSPGAASFPSTHSPCSSHRALAFCCQNPPHKPFFAVSLHQSLSAQEL